MPIYDYECRDCLKAFTIVEPISEHGKKEPRCPACESKRVERVLSTFAAKTSRKF